MRVTLHGASVVELRHPEHGDRVTIHLPMDVGRFARVLQVLADAGFEFERVGGGPFPPPYPAEPPPDAL